VFAIPGEDPDSIQADIDMTPVDQRKVDVPPVGLPPKRKPPEKKETRGRKPKVETEVPVKMTDQQLDELKEYVRIAIHKGAIAKDDFESISTNLISKTRAEITAKDVLYSDGAKLIAEMRRIIEEHDKEGARP